MAWVGKPRRRGNHLNKSQKIKKHREREVESLVPLFIVHPLHFVLFQFQVDLQTVTDRFLNLFRGILVEAQKSKSTVAYLFLFMFGLGAQFRSPSEFIVRFWGGNKRTRSRFVYHSVFLTRLVVRYYNNYIKWNFRTVIFWYRMT